MKRLYIALSVLMLSLLIGCGNNAATSTSNKPTEQAELKSAEITQKEPGVNYDNFVDVLIGMSYDDVYNIFGIDYDKFEEAPVDIDKYEKMKDKFMTKLIKECEKIEDGTTKTQLEEYLNDFSSVLDSFINDFIKDKASTIDIYFDNNQPYISQDIFEIYNNVLDDNGETNADEMNDHLIQSFFIDNNLQAIVDQKTEDGRYIWYADENNSEYVVISFKNDKVVSKRYTNTT